MSLFFPLLGLGLTAGGVFAGTLQQNLSQAEKPKIDELFEEIVKKMKEFSKENPMTEKSLEEIRRADADDSDEKTTAINNANSSELLSQYTF